MVITEKFAWAHLPKAAGDATRSMFASVPGLVIFQAPSESNEKHNGYWVHEREIGDRLRVMNIRRLPSWILSAAHHKAASGLHPDYTPLPMPSVDEMTADTDPDGRRVIRLTPETIWSWGINPDASKYFAGVVERREVDSDRG